MTDADAPHRPGYLQVVYAAVIAALFAARGYITDQQAHAFTSTAVQWVAGIFAGVVAVIAVAIAVSWGVRRTYRAAVAIGFTAPLLVIAILLLLILLKL